MHGARHRAAFAHRHRVFARVKRANAARNCAGHRRAEIPRAFRQDPGARLRADTPRRADREDAAAGHADARAGPARHRAVHRHRLVAKAAILRGEARAARMDSVATARDGRAGGHAYRNGAVAVMGQRVARLHPVALGGNRPAGDVHPDVAGVVARRERPQRVLLGVRVVRGKRGQRRLQIAARQRRRQNRPLRVRKRPVAVAAPDMAGDGLVR